jgi:nucleotide-binding universal stress UspA family protein
LSTRHEKRLRRRRSSDARRLAVERLRIIAFVIERILIAADGSASGSEAIAYGLEIAEKHGAKVTFFHAMDPIALSLSNADTELGSVRPFPFRLDAAEEAMLEAATRQALARGVESNVEVGSGEPVAEIIEHAASIDADLIVVGSRGRSEVASSLLGSVSRGVLHEAPRPVLVVRRKL